MSIIKTIGQAIIGVGIEKPPYEVVSKKDGYEERVYEARKWVSTSFLGMVHEEARSRGFNRLFKYITGTNEKECKIDMTAPVTTKIVPGLGPNCESTFTESFYIPEVFQEAPVKPSNPEVFIEEVPKRTVYVRSFGGFAKDEQFIEEARKLTELLKDEPFVSDFYYTVGYDSPFKLMNRTNEVWFVKKE